MSGSAKERLSLIGVCTQNVPVAGLMSEIVIFRQPIGTAPLAWTQLYLQQLTGSSSHKRGKVIAESI